MNAKDYGLSKWEDERRRLVAAAETALAVARRTQIELDGHMRGREAFIEYHSAVDAAWRDADNRDWEAEAADDTRKGATP